MTSKSPAPTGPRRRSPRPARRPRLALACAVSLACHLVAVTLLASRGTPARATATLDGAISVYPNASLESGRASESQPPSIKTPSPPRPVQKATRPTRPRVRPTRPTRVAVAPAPALLPPPAPAGLTATTPGNGIAPQAPPARRAEPVRVGHGVARSLRIFDSFPRMPEVLRLQQRNEAVDVEICVSAQGSVRDVRLRGASEALARILREALFTWRYRPLIQADGPVPFCHDLRLTYRS